MQGVPAKLFGIWCSAHTIDLMADSVTNNEKRLPTSHKVGQFSGKLGGHVENNGKTNSDLQFLQKMMEDTLRVGSLRLHPRIMIRN